ncbi:hypothetical protein ACTOWA_04885 [Herbaspirillum seropedicae]|uniref:hypothetical protein n=1 Tax=Herbaspirillum seropedicae TaxID=964 RepID=UPI002862D331|nr:hypothetical protein [Herbaspirillum seropedicae]MDR6397282.1 hypothetical protein [Herbaspirillum seropedicae]
MSDHADNADKKIYGAIAAGLAAARRAPTLQPDCRCHFCDEQVAVNLLFCNIECRNDFDRVNNTRKKCGLS